MAVVAVVAAPRSSADAPQAPPPKAAPPPLPVQVYVVQSEAYAPTLTGSGELIANEAVDLSADLSRKVVEVKVEDGQHVDKGQVLFVLDSRDLEAQLARLRVQARFAKTSLGRYASLSESGAVSADSKDTTRLRVEDLQAQANELEVTIEKTRVVAPFAGTFGLRLVSVGAWVQPGTPLGRLADLDTLKLEVRLPERNASQVAVGSRLTFTVDGRTETFDAVVTAIAPSIVKTSRSVLVRARVDAPRGLLPGTFATAVVPLAPRPALFVPAISVVPSPTGGRVFVNRDGVVKEIPVAIGVREAARVEVTSGLAPGDRVIITNLLRVRNGAPVREVSAGDTASAGDAPKKPTEGDKAAPKAEGDKAAPAGSPEAPKAGAPR
ncbi:MAG: efflux RND transporter periplasmic adaptor subunit [Deltaproteobacteria bacterium]|nr:efflux RND transporter periplasmic adaptor subunit [Deltaproteobacteria bacterium]